jgi:hypothetical protein
MISVSHINGTNQVVLWLKFFLLFRYLISNEAPMLNFTLSYTHLVTVEDVTFVMSKVWYKIELHKIIQTILMKKVNHKCLLYPIHTTTYIQARKGVSKI